MTRLLLVRLARLARERLPALPGIRRGRASAPGGRPRFPPAGDRLDILRVGERLRIASELHDVVAHDLSVMTLAVGAGRVFMDRDPARAVQTLRAAEESGRRALSDLQRVMALLRVDDVPRVPQPRLAELPALLDAFTAAGLEVTLTEEGVRQAAPALELSAYRIVEEALGNAVRPGAARTAAVTLRWTQSVLDLTVRDDGAPRERLCSTWERASLFGGSVSARALPGGFEVRVRLLAGQSASVRPIEKAASRSWRE
ncbi:sensor histidine kinase [Microtetraspora niveoalba]|uniref:sensor histidine kinase n=1 Tax=Microtetraspora niveoalba TaxID=46175 RepID=UPI000833BD2F|nr:histidine kinase [Microtetraspora niveoalba]